MLRENLKDAGQIMENILTQPLDIPGTTPNVSLLSAAHSKNYEDLTKILEAFVQYRDPTQALITELELLIKDLRA